ncbi:hypothetical protein JVU11DRAFT_10607 [Chiua virens]|nr:hypothetical protein JVU11DRAFT_10607 [Chiua virens]
MEIHVGHEGSPCPNANTDANISISDDEDKAWEDANMADMPAHLRRPANLKSITIVNTSGVHFWRILYCQCTDAPEKHVQLFHAQLFTLSTIQLKMVFIFRVLDDFLRDNMECGISVMNYFSKLHWITSNTFPHMVPV